MTAEETYYLRSKLNGRVIEIDGKKAEVHAGLLKDMKAAGITHLELLSKKEYEEEIAALEYSQRQNQRYHYGTIPKG